MQGFGLGLLAKTILKNHPLVEDADAELKQLEKEALETQERCWQSWKNHSMICPFRPCGEIGSRVPACRQALDGRLTPGISVLLPIMGFRMVKDRRLLNSDELEEFQWDADYIKYGRERHKSAVGKAA